jgi:mono/diheme cytochrome c family protein
MKHPILFFLLAASNLMAAAPAPASGVARLYRVKCAGCHGPAGEGGVGPCLQGKLAHTPQQLFGVIRNGIPGTQMPPSGLPDPMIRQMVAFVEHLRIKK